MRTFFEIIGWMLLTIALVIAIIAERTLVDNADGGDEEEMPAEET